MLSMSILPLALNSTHKKDALFGEESKTYHGTDHATARGHTTYHHGRAQRSVLL